MGFIPFLLLQSPIRAVRLAGGSRQSCSEAGGRTAPKYGCVSPENNKNGDKNLQIVDVYCRIL